MNIVINMLWEVEPNTQAGLALKYRFRIRHYRINCWGLSRSCLVSGSLKRYVDYDGFFFFLFCFLPPSPLLLCFPSYFLWRGEENPQIICKIWGFYGGDSVCSHLLTLVPCLRIFLPWRWRQYVPPKCQFTQDLHIPEYGIPQIICLGSNTIYPILSCCLSCLELNFYMF
jgi:hypothetical protein